MQWLSEFKRAVIEKDFEKIEMLLDHMGEFRDEKEANTALALIDEAKAILFIEKEKTLLEMQKIQKTKKFVDSKKSSYSLDMSS